MDFTDLLKDIAKLEGMHLPSIRPGADIFVESVNIEHGKILVRTETGKVHSRSISEFQRIWDALATTPAVRVEAILNGSGSSRNQPETIFANLPYIEWLKIINKKHIAYVGKATHAYGTLKKMGGIQAGQLIERKPASDSDSALSVLIATKDLSESTNSFAKICGKSAAAVSAKMYIFELGTNSVVYVDSNEYGIPVGIYPVVPMTALPHFIGQVKVMNQAYGIVRINDFNGLIPLEHSNSI